MSALHPCERVGPDFIANASFRVVTGIELPVALVNLRTYTDRRFGMVT